MKSTRQRGIKASRIKLEHYMSNIGIRSQAQLARKIADLEGLESEPKDLVNRVFRQSNVEHQTLERIARALGVDAYQLYLSTDDKQILDESHQASSADPLSSEEDSTKSPNHYKKSLVIISATFIVVIALLFIPHSKQTFQQTNSSVQALSSINSLVVPTHADLYPLAEFFVEEKRTARMTLLPYALLNGFIQKPQTLERFEMDVIWSIEKERYGRYLSLFLQHYSGTATTRYYIASMTESEFTQSYRYLSKRIYEVMAAHIYGHNTPTSENRTKDTLAFSLAKKIVSAREVAEQLFDAQKISATLLEIESTSSESAEYLAAQCMIKTNFGWQNNEKKSLEQARTLCERALFLDDQHPFVLTTNAFRLFRNGQIIQAQKEYFRILQLWPENIESLLGLAQINMHFFREDTHANKIALEQAITNAQRVAAIEPGYWKSYHLLTNFFYLSNQPHKALEVTKKLAEVDPSPIALANGALLSLCLAELSDSNRFATKMLELDPESYIAYETLFFINAYQNRPNEALMMMQNAMSGFSEDGGGLFLQWGQLADAHRWLGNTELAKKYYEIALIEYQQDESKNQTTDNDIAFSLYFQIALQQLDGVAVSDHLSEKLNAMEVDAMASSSQLKAAVSYAWLGNLQKAKTIKNNIVGICPIYASYPDLRFL